MKTRHLTLTGKWDKLLDNSLRKLTELIPACDTLKELTRVINSIAAVSKRYAINTTGQLNSCRKQLEALIPACPDMDTLIKTTKCIARVAKQLEPEWTGLLDLSRDRLAELLPECDNTGTIVNTLTCMAQIATLIADEKSSDDEPEKTLSATKDTTSRHLSETTSATSHSPEIQISPAKQSAIEDTRQRIAAIHQRLNQINAGT